MQPWFNEMRHLQKSAKHGYIKEINWIYEGLSEMYELYESKLIKVLDLSCRNLWFMIKFINKILKMLFSRWTPFYISICHMTKNG